MVVLAFELWTHGAGASNDGHTRRTPAEFCGFAATGEIQIDPASSDVRPRIRDGVSTIVRLPETLNANDGAERKDSRIGGDATADDACP
jgi:hypothetical protein